MDISYSDWVPHTKFPFGVGTFRAEPLEQLKANNVPDLNCWTHVCTGQASLQV